MKNPISLEAAFSFAPLERIHLLNNRERNDDIIFLKLVDAAWIVKNNMGIQNKGFRWWASRHRAACSFAMIAYWEC